MEINGPQRLTSLAVVAAVMVTGRYCADSASIRPCRYRARVARKQYPRWTLFVSAALLSPGLQQPANHPAPAIRNSEEKTAPGTMMVMMAIMMAAPRIMSLPIAAESLSGATTFASPPVKPRQIRRPTAQGADGQPFAPLSCAARLSYFTALLSAVGQRLIGRMLLAGRSGKLGGFTGGGSPGARKQRAPITRTSDLRMRMFPNSSNSPQRPECDAKGCDLVAVTAMWSSQVREMPPLRGGPVRPAAA